MLWCWVLLSVWDFSVDTSGSRSALVPTHRFDVLLLNAATLAAKVNCNVKMTTHHFLILIRVRGTLSPLVPTGYLQWLLIKGPTVVTSKQTQNLNYWHYSTIILRKPFMLPYHSKPISKKYKLTCVVLRFTKTSARLGAGAGLPRRLLLFQGRGSVRRSRRDVSASLFLALFSAYIYISYPLIPLPIS